MTCIGDDAAFGGARILSYLKPTIIYTTVDLKIIRACIFKLLMPVTDN